MFAETPAAQSARLRRTVSRAPSPTDSCEPIARYSQAALARNVAAPLLSRHASESSGRPPGSAADSIAPALRPAAVMRLGREPAGSKARVVDRFASLITCPSIATP